MKLTLDTSQLFAAVGRALMGHGAFEGRGRCGKLALVEGMVEITRPFLVVMGIPAAGMGALLANEALPTPPVLLLGAAAVALAVAAAHAFNDWVDRRRDSSAWPARPIPAGRVPAALALAFAGTCACVSLALTRIFFGQAAFLTLLLSQALAALYCLFMRDALGYLSLPPIIALFPLGGWAAVSPQTLFGSPTPWLLAAIVFTWQSAHIAVYMPAHPVSFRGGKPRCEKKAFLFCPTPRQAALLGVTFSALLVAGVTLLGLLVSLGVIYWVLALPIAMATLAASLRLLSAPLQKTRAILAFNTASMALASICGGVCLDVIARLHIGPFVSWSAGAAAAAAAWVDSRLTGVSALAYWLIFASALAAAAAGIARMLKEMKRGAGE